tara:strand:+ start:106 stop:1011 length:906 start_codon:yes stop_codon:yes gene_type:complete
MIETGDAARGVNEDVNTAIPQGNIDNGANLNVPPITNTEGTPAGQVSSAIEQTVEQSPEPVQEAPNKLDQQRFEYWQSQYDRSQGEVQALQNELQQAAQYVQQVQQQGLQPSPSNGQPTGVQNQETPLQKPTRPQKPHTYNEVDAFNDPDSESFKYRAALDGYRDSMIDFYDERDAAMSQQMEMQYRVAEEQRLDGDARRHVINHLGWDENKTDGFMQWVKNPNNVTFDVLAQIYDNQNAPTQEQYARQQKVQEMQNMKSRLDVPLTTQVTTGTTPPPQTDEQAFSASLLSRGKAMAKGIR